METDLKEAENGEEIVYVDEDDELDLNKPLVNVKVEENSGISKRLFEFAALDFVTA